MAEKRLNVRIINKHDSAENWQKATGFIPEKGELIIYDIDGNYSYERFKIGDGVKNVNALPFADDALKTELVAQINAVDDKVDEVNVLVGDKKVSVQIDSAVKPLEAAIDTKADAIHMHDWSDMGETIKETQIISNTEITGISHSGIYLYNLDSNLFPEKFDLVLVVFDGVEYNCPVTIDEGFLFGNISKFGLGDDTGEPFVAQVVPGEYAQIAMFDGNSHSVSITTFTTNYIKIPNKYLPDLMPQPKCTTITLPAANWTGNSNPWSQVVTINGVTVNSKVDLQPTAVQIVELQNEEIALMAENDDGVVTVYSIGNKPTVDYTMQVLITEVAVV